MRARRIIQEGAFAPSDVARLQQAFDMAWKRIQLSVPEDDHARAREALATIVVSAGNISELDAGELAAFAQRTYSTIWPESKAP